MGHGMLVQLVLGLITDLLFESPTARRRRLDAQVTRYLDRRRRVGPAAPPLRKPA